MRTKAKRDANESDIIDALRSIGATVQPISETNVPDLLVGFRGVNLLMEVKIPKGKLSTGQKSWHDTWEGQRAVVRSVDEALSVLGILYSQEHKK